MVFRRLMVFTIAVLMLAFTVTVYADFTMGKTLVINADDSAASDAVNIGGDVHVNGSVAGDAVAVGGNVYIENGGVVKENVVAVGGFIIVRPNGYIGGDAVAIGGKITIEEGGTVVGEKVDLSAIPVPFVGGLKTHLCEGISLGEGLKSIGKLILFGPLFGVLGFFGFAIFTGILLLKILFLCAISVLAIWFAPRHVRSLAEYTRFEPVKVFFAGFVSFILIPVIFILLLVTILGIPFIPVFLSLVFIAKLFGSVGIALWAGWLLPGSERRSDIHNAFLGVLVFGLLRFIPVAGLLVKIVAGMMAIGVVVLTRFGTRHFQQA